MAGSEWRARVEAVRGGAVALARGADGPWDGVLEAVGGARLVLLGESTHGTHEFYRARAWITRRLVVERGFNAVAVEADWPDAARVDRWVRGRGGDGSAVEALGAFRRFPQWMWRNTEVVRFVEWMRRHNDERPEHARVRFHGLDMYSMFASIDAVIRYLDRVDADAAARARRRYGCFERAGGDPQAYGHAAELGIGEACRDEAVRQLREMRERAADAAPEGAEEEDLRFEAEQNARLVKNAEEYYRSMFSTGVSSWNLRDCHMVDTLDALTAHLESRGLEPRVVVWAHNSHLGDSRATEMEERGEWNVGRLARERHGDAARLIGFTTRDGSVTAASDWNAPAERKRVREALPGSVEALLHETAVPELWLPLSDGGEAAAALEDPLLERAIGVIYRPETERWSHYFHAAVAAQFDGLVHLDRTRALHPLERTAAWTAGERGAGLDPPETYPTGL
jgi:erythromycin esterase-like protein